MKIEGIQKGAVDITELVELSFLNYTGWTTCRCWASDLKQVRTKSICEDDVLATTCELKKLKNHIELGISLTGSRKVVEIMNRLGHCISYDAKEEIEKKAMCESTK